MERWGQWCVQVHAGHLYTVLRLAVQSCPTLCDPVDCSHAPKDTQLQDGDDVLPSTALLPAEWQLEFSKSSKEQDNCSNQGQRFSFVSGYIHGNTVPDITLAPGRVDVLNRHLLNNFFDSCCLGNDCSVFFFFFLNSSRFVVVWAEVENWEITDLTIIDFIRDMNVLRTLYIKNSLLLYWPHTLHTTFMGPKSLVLFPSLLFPSILCASFPVMQRK